MINSGHKQNVWPAPRYCENLISHIIISQTSREVNPRAEAVQHKAAVKRGEMSLSDYTSWLAQMQDEADSLMEVEMKQ